MPLIPLAIFSLTTSSSSSSFGIFLKGMLKAIKIEIIKAAENITKLAQKPINSKKGQEIM